MTTPHAFILARLAEDEQAAREDDAASLAAWFRIYRPDGGWGISAQAWMDLQQIIARHDPARVLDQCAALRAVVELAWDDHLRIEPESGDVPPIIRALTAIWSTHADYDEGWAG